MIKKWHIFVLFYFILLGLSWLVQDRLPFVSKLFSGEESVFITYDEATVPINYIRFQTGNNNSEVVLLPDIYFGPEFLIPFGSHIHNELKKNVIIPFYPEKNSMGRRISHSISGRANFIDQLLDSLSITEVDLIGHGYGGLVAIDLSSGNMKESTKMRSLTLLSSLGVVELQFLGNHTFNRAIYSFLYPISWLYKWAVPHFGYFDLQPVKNSYIRALRQKDQRPVREQLENIDIPVLILHPLNDNIVSLSVAEENHRLLPQSYLLTHEASEHSIFKNPEKWAVHLHWFIEAVKTSDVNRRENAHILRIELSNKEFDAASMRSIGGTTLLIVVLLLALFTLVSEDIACIAGGIIVATGVLPFWFAVFGCFIGIIIANIGVYLIGRKAGSPILDKKPVKWIINPGDLKKAQNMFEMRGMEIIFVTRFIPGTRLPAYLAAGILKTSFLQFLVYFLLSLVVWIPLMVGVSALVGQPMLKYIEIYQDYALWVFFIIIAFIYLLIRLFIPLATVSGRRKLVVRWGRFREKYFGANFNRPL